MEFFPEKHLEKSNLYQTVNMKTSQQNR